MTSCSSNRILFFVVVVIVSYAILFYGEIPDCHKLEYMFISSEKRMR